jgi:hypothetical protein
MRTPWLASLLLTACTVGGADPLGNGGSPDAGAGARPDAPTSGAACALGSGLGSLGTLSNAVVELHNQPGTQGAKKFYSLTVPLSSDPSDLLVIQLWGQTGAFTGPVAPGTYPIAGADAQYVSCGMCAFALGDTAKPTAQKFLASAGSANITALGAVGQPVTVALTGVTFGQLDGTTNTAIGGGCQSQLASVTLTGTLVDKTGGGGGGGGGGGKP